MYEPIKVTVNGQNPAFRWNMDCIQEGAHQTSIVEKPDVKGVALQDPQILNLSQIRPKFRRSFTLASKSWQSSQAQTWERDIFHKTALSTYSPLFHLKDANMVQLEEVKDPELDAPQPGPTSDNFEDDADFTDAGISSLNPLLSFNSSFFLNSHGAKPERRPS